MPVIKEFDLTRLPIAPNQDRPTATYAHYLHLASHHDAEHQGQIDYLVGLMKGRMGV